MREGLTERCSTSCPAEDSTMQMADSLDHLLGNRDSTGTGPSTNPGSRCTSRPISAGNDMNGPRLADLSESVSKRLDGQLCPQATPDLDSCGETDGLMDADSFSSGCGGGNNLNHSDGGFTSFVDLVRINVGGTVFVTQRSTLSRIPDTRLSRLSYSDANYNKDTGEWFFDRNPALFNSFLDFYRTDELHFPHSYCGPSIKKELIFWQIEECDISPCCWNRYREFEQEQKIFDHIEQAFESRTLAEYELEDELATTTKWEKLKKKIYIFMEEPMSSQAAKIWTVAFLSFVLISIGILCIETLPQLRYPKDNYKKEYRNLSMGSSPYFGPTMAPVQKNYTNHKIKTMVETKPHPVLEHIDSFLTSFFTLEFVLRFIVCPNKVKFWRSIMNIIDVLCVLPMWIKYIMQLKEIDIDEDLLPVFFIIMVLRVLRICRVLRLARHYTGVKILLLALKASLRELFMLLVFVFIVILIFAVVIYYAEFFEQDTFPSIPSGYWWAIITLTTVGYGDMYPVSWPGYIVGALCALTGILATGLPVPIIANNFNLYYSHAALKEAVAGRKPRTRKCRVSQEDLIPISDKETIVLKEASV